MMKRREWGDLTPAQKLMTVLTGTLQFVLLIAALWDIRQRSEEEVNGTKKMWTAIAFINYVGPIAYFAFGRKR
jgi:hypothetical protein